MNGTPLITLQLGLHSHRSTGVDRVSGLGDAAVGLLRMTLDAPGSEMLQITRDVAAYFTDPTRSGSLVLRQENLVLHPETLATLTKCSEVQRQVQLKVRFNKIMDARGAPFREAHECAKQESARAAAKELSERWSAREAASALLTPEEFAVIEQRDRERQLRVERNARLHRDEIAALWGSSLDGEGSEDTATWNTTKAVLGDHLEIGSCSTSQGRDSQELKS